MLRSCALALAMLLLALAVPAFAQTTATGGSPSGGTPALATGSDPTMSSSGGAETPAEASEASSAGADAPMSGDMPLATVAQEPEPEPEGPGEEQPDEPVGEPQTPTGDDPVEVPSGETPATSGGLPSTGIEVLQLALLGLVLVLVGARIRAVLKRRGGVAELAPDGLPHGAPTVDTSRTEPSERDDAEPEYAGVEATPTGLLPSTATARRNARMHEED